MNYPPETLARRANATAAIRRIADLSPVLIAADKIGGREGTACGLADSLGFYPSPHHCRDAAEHIATIEEAAPDSLYYIHSPYRDDPERRAKVATAAAEIAEAWHTIEKIVG
jgi:hypothetical protein